MAPNSDEATTPRLIDEEGLPTEQLITEANDAVDLYRRAVVQEDTDAIAEAEEHIRATFTGENSQALMRLVNSNKKFAEWLFSRDAQYLRQTTCTKAYEVSLEDTLERVTTRANAPAFAAKGVAETLAAREQNQANREQRTPQTTSARSEMARNAE